MWRFVLPPTPSASSKFSDPFAKSSWIQRRKKRKQDLGEMITKKQLVKEKHRLKVITSPSPLASEKGAGYWEVKCLHQAQNLDWWCKVARVMVKWGDPLSDLVRSMLDVNTAWGKLHLRREGTVGWCNLLLFSVSCPHAQLKQQLFEEGMFVQYTGGIWQTFCGIVVVVKWCDPLALFIILSSS